MTPTIWNLVLAVMLVVEMVMLKQSMNNTDNAVTVAKEATKNAKAWRKFSNDIVNITKAGVITEAALKGFDVKAYSFDENDQREATKLLHDLRETGEQLRAMRKEKKAEPVAPAE